MTNVPSIAFWEHTPPYDPAAGGIASYIQHRAQLLGRLGFDVWWANSVTCANWAPSRQEWTARRHFPIGRLRRPLLGRWPALSPVWRYLAEERAVDLFEFQAGLNSWLSFRPGGPKIVLQCHTSTETRAFLNRDGDVEKRCARFKKWARRNLRQAAGIVACSNEIAMLEAGLFHVHPDRMCILPHAFRLEADPGLRRRNAGDGDGTFLVVGNVEYFKGLDLILRGFEVYLQGGGTHCLAVAGCGGLHELRTTSAIAPIKSTVEKLWRDYGAERIQFLGKLDKAALAKRRSAATALVCGSRFEAFTMVAGEAFLTGCPVILSSRTGWNVLANRYRAARLMDPYDALDVAAAMGEMENGEARNKYRQGGDALGDYLQSPELANKTAQFYRRALGEIAAAK